MRPAAKILHAADNARLLELRITPNEIKLPAGRTGLYAYTEYRLVLAVDCAHRGLSNGSKLSVALLTEQENLERNKNPERWKSR
ncbi:MAG: hypothetical protein ACTTKL_10215 [Treponema sp.]